MLCVGRQAGGKVCSGTKEVKKVGTSAAAKASDSLDDIFGSAKITGKSGTSKAVHANSANADAAALKPPANSAGPDMEQVKKEASKFLGGGKGERDVVDGVKVYSESELEKEMGETSPARAISSAKFSF